MPVKAFWLNLLISLLIVFTISCGAGVLLSIWLPFWKATGSVFVLLYALLFWLSAYTRNKKEIAETQFAEKLIAEESRNTVKFVCACNQNTIVLPVYANGSEDDNKYTCSVCKNDFNIQVDIQPILQTRAVGQNLPLEVFAKLREEDTAAVTQ